MGKKWKTIETSIIDPEKGLEENEIKKYVESLLGPNYKEEKWNNVSKKIKTESNEEIEITLKRSFINEKQFNKKVLCGILMIDENDILASCDIIIYQEQR